MPGLFNEDWGVFAALLSSAIFNQIIRFFHSLFGSSYVFKGYLLDYMCVMFCQTKGRHGRSILFRFP